MADAEKLGEFCINVNNSKEKKNKKNVPLNIIFCEQG